MSTVAKICSGAPVEKMTHIIKNYLIARDISSSYEQSDRPLSVKAESFMASDAFPTILSLKSTSRDTAEIHFNSFSKVRELCRVLSDQLRVPVVVNHYQSVATASYWAYYSSGVLQREIQAGDGEIFAEFGEPLACEVEDDASLGVAKPFFDYRDMDLLNKLVGVNVGVYGDLQVGWHNFVIEARDAEKRAW